MAVVKCGVLVVVSMFAMAVAYFPVRQPNYFGGPWYDTSCRESIEDLKALMEVSQSFKQDGNNYSCSTCATTFSEEVIMKLINALIFTATHNCGYNSGDGGYYSGGSNNVGGGSNVGGGNNAGGLIGGGNTLGLLGPVTGGGNTGVVNPGGAAGEGSSGGTSSKSDDGLINLGLLTGKDTLSLGLGGTKLLDVDVGKQSGSSNVPSSPTPAIPTSSEQGGNKVSNEGNSNNLGGVTNPTNNGDVNQVNQQVSDVTNILPSN